MRGETLGGFLKTRRDKTDPASIGIEPGSKRRRCPGLRREELAARAKVSVGYYIRIEQDQAGTASMQVLESLASAMHFSDIERSHMHNLARSGSSVRMVREPEEKPHRRVLALFESLQETMPAVVLGRRGDILAWNRSGHDLFFEKLPFDAPTDPARRPSVPSLFFLDPDSREFHRNWDDLARIHVAYLRLTFGRFPADAALAELINDLTVKSARFAELWDEGDVMDCTVGNMLLAHPKLGDLDVDYQVWLQPESPDHRLEVYTPNDDASIASLRSLSLSSRSAFAPGPRSRGVEVHRPYKLVQSVHARGV